MKSVNKAALATVAPTKCRRIAQIWNGKAASHGLTDKLMSRLRGDRATSRGSPGEYTTDRARPHATCIAREPESGNRKEAEIAPYYLFISTSSRSSCVCKAVVTLAC